MEPKLTHLYKQIKSKNDLELLLLCIPAIVFLIVIMAVFMHKQQYQLYNQLNLTQND